MGVVHVVYEAKRSNLPHLPKARPKEQRRALRRRPPGKCKAMRVMSLKTMRRRTKNHGRCWKRKR
jgi:hypothetical protein